MEIKGTAVIAIRDFVKSNYPAKYEVWLDSLPADSKRIFSGIIDTSQWYPLQHAAIIPTRKIGDIFFNGNHVEGSWESGKYSAQKALTGVYKVFVKASSPSYIIERASRVFATYYRPCEMLVKNISKTNVTLQISNMTESDEVIEYRIAGWIQRAMEISGAKKINVDISKSIARGDAITQLDISWT